MKVRFSTYRRDETSDDTCSQNETSDKIDYPVMSYICQCKPRPGALSMEKCLELGVPKGPLLGKLKNGETLTLENGVTVRPENVLEPGDPGPIFLGIFFYFRYLFFNYKRIK